MGGRRRACLRKATMSLVALVYSGVMATTAALVLGSDAEEAATATAANATPPLMSVEVPTSAEPLELDPPTRRAVLVDWPVAPVRVPAIVTAPAVGAPRLHDFFRLIDTDADGDITPEEASAFIASEIQGADFDTEGEVDQGGAAAIRAVDESGGGSVSFTELNTHLGAVMTSPRSVAQWVSHGVGLPQYSDAFLSE